MNFEKLVELRQEKIDLVNKLGMEKTLIEKEIVLIANKRIPIANTIIAEMSVENFEQYINEVLLKKCGKNISDTNKSEVLGRGYTTIAKSFRFKLGDKELDVTIIIKIVDINDALRYNSRPISVSLIDGCCRSCIKTLEDITELSSYLSSIVSFSSEDIMNHLREEVRTILGTNKEEL